MQDGGIRTRVLAPTLGEIFEDLPELGLWRDEFWRLVEKTHNLDWIVQTRHPDRVGEMTPGRWLDRTGYIPDNLWFAFTASTRCEAELACRAARHIPAQHLVLVLEPLLEEVSILRFLSHKRATVYGRALLFFRWWLWAGRRVHAPASLILPGCTASLGSVWRCEGRHETESAKRVSVRSGSTVSSTLRAPLASWERKWINKARDLHETTLSIPHHDYFCFASSASISTIHCSNCARFSAFGCNSR